MSASATATMTATSATAVTAANSSESQSHTWSSLKASIRDSRRSLSGASALPLRTPSSFAFRGLGDVLRTRLYFLSSFASKESTLLYVDVDDSSPTAASDSPLPWCPLLETAFQTGGSGGGLGAKQPTKEEQLLFERRRSFFCGISEYELNESSGKFVFPMAGALFGCTDPGSGGSGGSGSPPPAPLCPYEIKSTCNGSRMNPSLCPCDDDLVAFVGNSDIWVTRVSTGQEVRLTHARKGKSSLLDDPLSAGYPSFVTQEEFNRYTGMWWRPNKTGGRYQILYEEVDEGDVELFRFPATCDASSAEEFRFPRAGTANSKSILKLIEFGSGLNGEITDIVIKELNTPLDHFFPWLEYIVRLGWTPEGKYIWVQLLDRRQRRLELVLFSPDNFTLAAENNHIESVGSSSLSSANGFENGIDRYHVVYRETSDRWVSVTNVLSFLPSDDPSKIVFIWASEESGFQHLYLVVAQISTHESDCADVAMEEETFVVRPRILQKIALTTGDWSVLGERDIWVDVSRDLVYFEGLKDSPLERHLYVVSIAEPGHVRRLTTAGFSHSISMNKDCSMFVTIFSSIQSLTACQIFRISHSDSTVEGLSLVPAGWIIEQKNVDNWYRPPELFSHILESGEKLYGMIFKPKQIEHGEKYPVVLNVYGGPEVQLVSNTFMGYRQIRNHLIAHHGYCVVCIDTRGSHNRGVEFEAHVYRRMGQVEMREQVEVLQWLGKVKPYMDMDRVAVHGWSYGGYLSLMGLAQFSNFFKVAVAGAPVVAWTNYDTAYTERYMDLPSENPNGYVEGSLLSHLHNFPEQPNRLLIAHGLSDENVHFFSHTSQLINQLMKLGKPYQLQVYPGERHSMRHFDAVEHFETTFLFFLNSNL